LESMPGSAFAISFEKPQQTNGQREGITMEEPIINKNIGKVIVGILLLGGAAALLRLYRLAKSQEDVPSAVMEESGEDIFV
jgi:hypothetical protein